MTLKRQSIRALVAEFMRALLDRYTYSPHKNPETLFGFLWGLPIPIFTLAIHLHATGANCTFRECLDVLVQNPIYGLFLAHPFFFAIIFGTHGTIRAWRDLQIKNLVADMERHCDDLCKANAKLTEVDRLKSEFLANVTHELKSPLVTALGYSDRILNEKLGPVTDRQRKALQVSTRNLIRLRTLIEEILDFSRLEAGVGSFRLIKTDLKEVLDTAIADLLLKARERDIAIAPSLPQEGAWVIADAARVTQAVENLLDNAIKFSPEGNTVAVSLTADTDFWHLKITNQGPGIAPEHLSRLFQRFSQADGSTLRPYNGVGLGLVIVKKIVDAHAGEVWLESQPGVGTSAHVTLRRAPAECPEEREVAHATSSMG